MEKDMERVNLLVPAKIFRQIKQSALNQQITTSKFIRKAIVYYMRVSETKMIKEKLKEGYQANYEYYERQQKDWQHADKE